MILVDGGLDVQAGPGCSFGDQVDDRLPARQWLAAPVLGDDVTGCLKTRHRMAQFRGSKLATEFSPGNA